MTNAEIAEAKRALAALFLPDDRLKTRRLKRAAHGRIDPRRTMRASLKVGGDIIMPAFRARAENTPADRRALRYLRLDDAIFAADAAFPACALGAAAGADASSSARG